MDRPLNLPDGVGGGDPQIKLRTAALSVGSNSVLILLKVVAGSLTGSVAILTEAVHSSIDLVASVVAFFSVRKAGEPADESHRYGHEKVENLAAAIEGILILVGSAAIGFQCISQWISSPARPALRCPPHRIVPPRFRSCQPIVSG